ncbi:hypothetical protein Closa_1517 [[Clostridium] saccharolyticum WM1]|uniref:Uncharacterized protein n=1 Tax=Lacrimispora saccharolytica (strain ATCC 35040 / DSM 2544 / NRCC 2533 / WM1) TaxID=610130 RepID=D9R9R5_LACSW|nr:hypothetical protein Closa_1517 [[Clostridium] saccharolyticum WM1]
MLVICSSSCYDASGKDRIADSATDWNVVLQERMGEQGR